MSNSKIYVIVFYSHIYFIFIHYNCCYCAFCEDELDRVNLTISFSLENKRFLRLLVSALLNCGGGGGGAFVNAVKSKAVQAVF